MLTILLTQNNNNLKTGPSYIRREPELMNYQYIEKLVKNSKDGDKKSKEDLAKEFTPYILNLCGRTFIHGYDFSDLKNECFKNLFKCVSLYNPEKHRFVAYATNAIKNNIFDLIRKAQHRRSAEGSESLIITDGFEERFTSDSISIEDALCIQSEYNDLHDAVSNLGKDEQEIINFLFFSHNCEKKTIKEYALLKNIPYSCAAKRRKTALKKFAVSLNRIKTLYY